ncbi:MAG: hypothetical protein RIR84_148, partial [Bacteroidota bacterium]
VVVVVIVVVIGKCIFDSNLKQMVREFNIEDIQHRDLTR